MGDAVIIPGWHPIVVHFPLALILSAVLLLSLARLLRNPQRAATLAVVGTWNLCLGAAGVLFALGTGLAASIDLQVSAAAHHAIGLHVKAAVLSTLLVLLLTLWRGVGAAHDSRPSWLFVIVLWAAGAALVVTGFRGGQNVYRFGIGVHSGALVVRPVGVAPGAIPDATPLVAGVRITAACRPCSTSTDTLSTYHRPAGSRTS